MVVVCCLSVGALADVWSAAPELHDVELLKFDCPEALLGHGAHAGPGRLVTVLGEHVPAPEALAQRLHLQDDLLSILILTSPERNAALAQRLQRTPFIGTSTRLHLLGDPSEAVPLLCEALESAARRRTWKSNIDSLREGTRFTPTAPPRVQRTLDLLLDRAPIGVVLLDALGRVASYNRLGGLYFGLDDPERRVRSLFEVLSDEDHTLLTALLASPGAPQHGPSEIDLSPALSPPRMLRLQVAALDPFEPRDGLLLLAQDVTERRAMQAQLFEARKLESVGRLAGGIAHDFNNLLTVILGYAEQVENSFPVGEPRRDAVAQIRFAAERAAELTTQLLTFARRKPMSPARLDVQREIEACTRLLQRLIGSRVRLTVSVDERLPDIWMDASQFQQLLMNLAVNARDAMPDGGELVIRARSADAVGLTRMPAASAAVEIEVSDTGIGMDEETLRHVFEPFFTTKDPGRGTGLGLATCHGIVEQAGGRITVESRPGAGCLFTLSLPAVAPLAPSYG